MRRPVRPALVLGLLAALIVALVRVLGRESRPGPAPLTAPPARLPPTTPVVRTPVPVQTPAPDPVAEPVTGSAAGPTDPITGSPPQPVEPGPSAVWVAAVEGGCPDGYPIKAKVSSGIYHRPGGLSYERTRPDRCYRDETAAEADGFRAAKR